MKIITGRCNSNYVTNLDDQNSVFGTQVNLNNIPIIITKISMQKIVDLLATEAEINAATSVHKICLLCTK